MAVRETTRSATTRRTSARKLLRPHRPTIGSTVGQGLWKLFQDFIKNPSDVDGIAEQMEAAAAKAYK